VLGPGSHGSTFGGNPVACAAGCAVLDELFERDMAGRAAAVGARLAAGLRDIVSACPDIALETRGKGLMAGLALRIDAAPVRDRCRERGLLVNVTSRNVLRFLPPLIIGVCDVDDALTMLRDALGIPGDALGIPGDALRGSSTPS
jgi:acetylornithine/succinyldiaminopimelate/putrescine aminotransferase